MNSEFLLIQNGYCFKLKQPMKKILVLAAVMITSVAIAQKVQEKNLPAVVKAAFQKQYPNVTKAKWTKEGDKFEASFDLNKVETSVVMDASGSITETEAEIEANQLPKGVAEYVKANYK